MSRRPGDKSLSLFTTSAITIISIALVLLLLGLTVLIGFTARGFASYLKENLGISIELAENTSEADITKLKQQLDNNPYVKSAVYISKEEIKKQLIADLGQDPEEVLGYDPSKSYFDVYIKADYVHPDSMALVEKSLKEQTLIKNVSYDEEDIKYANSNLSTVGSVLILLALILVLISFTLIRSIIRLNIYSKRFLIKTMQLVGATNSFIRRPFVWSMIGYGVVAAILGNIAITAVVYFATKSFPASTAMVSLKELIIVYCIVIICGILIATSATVMAVNKYLKMTTNKIYRA